MSFWYSIYRRRLRRVIAAPPNNLPKQSARTVWASSRARPHMLKQFQKHMQKSDAEILFLSDFSWFWGSMGLPRGLLAPSWKQVPKKPQNGKLLSPVLGAILGQFRFRIVFFCIFCVSFFLLVFGITFGRPPVPFLRIWGSFQGVFWGNFQDFFADAATLKNTTFQAKCLV